jgi:hypothetical protein
MAQGISNDDMIVQMNGMLSRILDLLENGGVSVGKEAKSRKTRTPRSVKKKIPTGWDAEVDETSCMSRVFTGGVVRQCSRKRKDGTCFCGVHLRQLKSVSPEDFAANPFKIFKNGFAGTHVPKQLNKKTEEMEYPTYFTKGSKNLPMPMIDYDINDDGSVSYRITAGEPSPDDDTVDEGDDAVGDQVDISSPVMTPKSQNSVAKKADAPKKSRRKMKVEEKTEVPSDADSESDAETQPEPMKPVKRSKGRGRGRRSAAAVAAAMEAAGECDDDDVVE